ncbi:hypothetical protein [Nonomuraea sp. NPDC005650]|uniref:hypothetical protein n=1 Tax=Nonomuraea sp. NPDC005650 TaxID=3157045 RepID=UPI0033B348B2
MHARMVRGLAVGVAGLALVLSPTIPAFAEQNGGTSERTAGAAQVASRHEWGGWYSSLDSCARAGREWVRLNGASGFICPKIDGRWALWAIFD